MSDLGTLQEIENEVLNSFSGFLREEVSPEKYMAAINQLTALIALAKAQACLRTLQDVEDRKKGEDIAIQKPFD